MLLSTPAIFDLTSGLSYKYLSDKVKTKKGGSLGYAVNVYDKGVIIKASPFPSYTKAALSMGNGASIFLPLYLKKLIQINYIKTDLYFNLFL